MHTKAVFRNLGDLVCFSKVKVENHLKQALKQQGRDERTAEESEQPIVPNVCL
jgi:hypothetical protein